ncbi:MAG TPA: hypothetical protein VGK61_03030 [Planctomycetota bacterium]|jgi:hypothetical protein
MADPIEPAPRGPRRFLSAGWIIAYWLVAVVGIFLAIRLPRCAELRSNLARLRAGGVRMIPNDWLYKFGAGEDFFAVFYDVPYLAVYRPDRVDPEHLEIFARLPNLTRVVLEDCELPADLGPIGRIRKLESLKLSRSKVTVTALASINPRNRIRRLDLVESGIRDADLGVLASWPELCELTLHPSQITPATLEAVRSLKALKELRTETRDRGSIAWHDLEGDLDIDKVMERVREFTSRR